MYIIFIILKERKCHFVHSLHRNFFLLCLFFFKRKYSIKKAQYGLMCCIYRKLKEEVSFIQIFWGILFR